MIRQRQMSLVVIIALLLSVSLLSSCAMNKYNETFTSRSYKSLSTAATFYDTTMKSIADLYKQGKVSEDDKAEAIELGNRYWESYHAAVAALELYERTRVEGDQGAAQSKIEEFEHNYNLFIQFVTPILDRYAAGGG